MKQAVYFGQLVADLNKLHQAAQSLQGLQIGATVQVKNATKQGTVEYLPAQVALNAIKDILFPLREALRGEIPPDDFPVHEALRLPIFELLNE